MKTKISAGVLVALALAVNVFAAPAKRVKITAQTTTLPATIHAQWDPPVAGDNVTVYTATLDGGVPIIVPTAIDSACNCIRIPLVVPTWGNHTFSVAAVSLLISTDPASTQNGPPAVMPFILAQPATVKNGKITK